MNNVEVYLNHKLGKRVLGCLLIAIMCLFTSISIQASVNGLGEFVGTFPSIGVNKITIPSDYTVITQAKVFNEENISSDIDPYELMSEVKGSNTYICAVHSSLMKSIELNYNKAEESIDISSYKDNNMDELQMLFLGSDPCVTDCSIGTIGGVPVFEWNAYYDDADQYNYGIGCVTHGNTGEDYITRFSFSTFGREATTLEKNEFQSVFYYADIKMAEVPENSVADDKMAEVSEHSIDSMFLILIICGIAIALSIIIIMYVRKRKVSTNMHANNENIIRGNKEDIYCRKCGKKIPGDSEFCISCGEKIVF